jgi:hypothetical protein
MPKMSWSCLTPTSRSYTLENLVEIQKQNTLEEAKEPEPGPEDRTVMVSKMKRGGWIYERCHQGV